MTTITFGIHTIESILTRAPARICALYVQEGALNPRLEAVCQRAEQLNISVQRVARHKLDEMTAGERHQGIVARCQPLATYEEADLYKLIAGLNTPALLLILDGVQDPHNLGACLRSADAAGVTAVIAPKDKATRLTPVVQKVASGAAETVPFVMVTNLARTMRELQQLGVWLVGASMEGSVPLFSVDLTGSIGWVLGAEGQGLRRLTKEHCDILAHIPMQGTVASLNVSVAAGISLFETVRQRLARQ
jgi:23S rRNA (guanosine2251-2'-O)-methyltransferase